MLGRRKISIVNANFNPFGFTYAEDSKASLDSASAVTGPGMGLGLENLLI